MNRPPRTIEVDCPQCRATMSVPESSSGTTVTCPDCLEDFVAAPSPIAKRTALPGGPAPITPDADDQVLQRLLNPDLDASPLDSGAIQIEDDLSSDTYPVKRKQILQSGYEFTVACVICGTRLDVNDSLIGEQIKCPDCHSAVAVRTPPPDRRRAPVHVAPVSDDEDEFGFADAPPTTTRSSPYHAIASELVAKAESEVARETLKVPRQQRDPVADSLQRAKQSLDEMDQQERPPLPKSPFRTRLLSFLLDPLTIARLIVLGLVLYVELGAIQLAIVGGDGGPQAQFVSVLFRMAAFTLGAVFATNLAVSLLGILQDSANGLDAIESWPDVNFLEWLGEACYVFGAMFLAVFPACAVAKVLSMVGAPDVLFWMICIVGGAAGIVLLFPFVLISMLESGSPLAPGSQTIVRSLRLAGGSWVVFMLLSSLVVGAGLGLAAVRVVWPNSTVLNLIVAMLLIIVAALYFRLLGRLTWCCDEAVLAEDLRLEEAAQASEDRG